MFNLYESGFQVASIFGRSYPSACIRHPPLVSSDLRTYADQFRARVPSNHAAHFPPFIPILRHNCFEMVVMGKNISHATNYGNFPHEGDLFILCIYIVKEVFCLAISPLSVTTSPAITPNVCGKYQG